MCTYAGLLIGALPIRCHVRKRGGDESCIQAPDVHPRLKWGWANLTVPGETNPDAQPVAQFLAVCWNAGKTIANLLRAQGAAHPVGLIDASLGSTRTECWMSPAAVASCDPVYNRSTPGIKTTNLSRCAHVEWVSPPGCGNFDIRFDHFSRIFTVYTTPHAPCAVLHFAPMLIGC